MLYEVITAEQGHDHGDVLLQRFIPEMLVRGERARQQFLEAVHAHVDGDGEPDGRPQRVAAADPVPELA